MKEKYAQVKEVLHNTCVDLAGPMGDIAFKNKFSMFSQAHDLDFDVTEELWYKLVEDIGVSCETSTPDSAKALKTALAKIIATYIDNTPRIERFMAMHQRVSEKQKQKAQQDTYAKLKGFIPDFNSESFSKV